MRSVLAGFLLSSSIALGQTTGVTVTVEPSTPLIEQRDATQQLEFDFAVHNGGRHTLRLIAIEAKVYDARGKLTAAKTVNSDGLRPGIEIVGSMLVSPGDTVDIFNPFFSFPSDVPLAELDYEFHYLIEDSQQQAEANRHRLPMDFDVSEEVRVTPADYRTKTQLQLPLHGRILVWEGHDYFAHHRRIPLDAAKTKEVGIRGANANRYASDLVIVNEKGEMWHDDPFRKANYYVYGMPIYSPADGLVKASRNDIPDNEFVNRHIRYPKLSADADDSLGNFVFIDHENGEFSVLPHMELGTVRVKAGERVRRGEIIGNVGFSGDAIFPHVHYSLISGPDIYGSEGVPAYFANVIRVLGDKKLLVERMTLDTGDLVQIPPNENSDAATTVHPEKKRCTR